MNGTSFVLILLALAYVLSASRTVKAWRSRDLLPPSGDSLWMALLAPLDVVVTIGVPVAFMFAVVAGYRAGLVLAWDGTEGIRVESIADQACDRARGTFEVSFGGFDKAKPGGYAYQPGDTAYYCKLPNGTSTRFLSRGREIVSATPNADPAKERL